MCLAVIQMTEVKRRKAGYFRPRVYSVMQTLKLETWFERWLSPEYDKADGDVSMSQTMKMKTGEVRCSWLYTVNSLKIKCCNATPKLERVCMA